MAHLAKYIFLYIVLTSISDAKDDDDLKDFDFSSKSDAGEEKEMMIAQESRQYKTVVKAPIRIVKPNGITNSHRPQYNIDSFEDDYVERKYKGNEADDLIDFFEEPTTKRYMEKDYKQSYKLRSKEAEIRNAVLRALGRKDHVGKFAQILPIIRAMSGSQRIALATLVANQVTTPPGRTPLNLAQVRSMFGNNDNTTTSLMLPILLDMANLIRRSVRSHKETRDVKQPPQSQMLRRSFTEEDDDTFLDADPFDRGYVPEVTTSTTTNAPTTRQINTQRSRNRNTSRNRPQKVTDKPNTDKVDVIEKKPESLLENVTVEHKNISRENVTNDVEHESFVHSIKKIGNSSVSSVLSTISPIKSSNYSKLLTDNSSVDLTADSTNHTISQDLPVAEKLRSINKYVDRKAVSLIRRGQRPFVKPSPPAPVTRRTNAESTLTPFRRRQIPARKLPVDHVKCELFTNLLCLHSEDYPTDAILLSIRRNKAAAGALLADFRDPGEGAVDGVTAAQEAKYTAEHYLTSNRRGDTANRDFASAGEAGFMCPSTVKYARPQRARATSGQWKYIVNTGEHTQTLRLEKCLKPKESCTYLTDNFKSKCVQVYNYHRLLTWDQQNGLHMDIFKVPTCCSCHIEGYSVAFPPLGHRIQETSSEQFPGEDLSPDHGNNAFESVQSSIQRPSITKKIPFSNLKPVESFHSFSDTHNLIPGAGFSNSKLSDNEEGNSANIPEIAPMDSYGNSYYPDSFNQATNIRNVKRPPGGRAPTATGNFDSVTLPSYLEPPTPSSGSSFAFGNDKSSKYKTTANQFKRGTRPNRRPIRKKISTASDDLMSSGTSAVESLTNVDEEYDDGPEDIQESVPIRGVTNTPKGYVTQPPKVLLVDKKPTTFKPADQSRPVLSNGKRVNYNYHPIIDFFESDGREEEEDEYPTIDRDDSISAIVASPESEWKPINLPMTRGTQSANLLGRKKH